MFFKRKKRAAEKSGSGTRSGSTAAGAGPDGDQDEASPGTGSGGADKASHTTQFLIGDANQDRRNVQVLLETIARVSMSRDLDSLLTYVVDSSIRLTGAERGLLILREPGDASGAHQVRTGRLKGGEDVEGDVRYSISFAAKVLDEGQPLRATVHSDSEALELGKSVYDLKLRAVMCVPLAQPGAGEGAGSSERPQGVLYVDSRAASRQFTQGDLALFAALAQQISIAMDNARLHDDSLVKLRLEQSLELASVIQRDLMPNIPKDLEGWDVHGWYRPAEEAAGDFYDFVKAKGAQLAIVVGDATGHGIGPALITATCQGSLRSSLRLVEDPSTVVTLLNEDLSERVEDGRFLTLFLAMLATDGTVRCVNAGHSFPFLWRAKTGAIEALGAGGPALGMIPDMEYEAHEPFLMEEGDVLVIYTDGLAEARDLEQPEVLFGDEGIQASLSLAAAAGENSEGIVRRLVEDALGMSNGAREDDITIVVARRTAGAS